MNEEDRILAFLTGRDKIPTTQIARLLGLDYYITRYILNQLEQKGSLKKTTKGRATYWVKR